MLDIDKDFYTRANAYIAVANAQCDGSIGVKRISASFMYAMARFNSWANATDYDSGNQMKETRDAVIDGLVADFKAMLEHNMDDHINNYDRLMTPPKE